MKKGKKRRSGKKVNKGAPSGLVISLALHAAAFFVAGLFVVFSVLPRPKPVFKAPPPAQRPKMDLKKPQVKVKKSSAPKPSSRIVAKVQLAKMPEISIPDLVGTGDGLLGSMGGVGDNSFGMPGGGNLATPFGETISTGNDLVGTFYDFKRNSSGSKRAINADYYDRPNGVEVAIHKFMKNDWNPRDLQRFYRAPKKLYTSCVCIGSMDAARAPEAFGEDETGGYAWMVHYKGKLIYPEDIKFRFRGVGESFMAVRVDEDIVLLSTYHAHGSEEYYYDLWESDASDNFIYPMADSMQEVGDWIELKGGEPKDLEIIVGDITGGAFCAQLAVEVEGEEYPRNPYGGGPDCPVFKMENLSWSQLDAIMMDVFPGDITLTNGPVFNENVIPPIAFVQPEPVAEPLVFLKDAVKEVRTWTAKDGSELKGELKMNMSDYLLLETASGQRRINKTALCDVDLEFLRQIDVPELNIEFSDRFNQIDMSNKANPQLAWGIVGSIAAFDYTFGVRMKSRDPVDYPYPLTVEYFAIGEEVHNSDNYVLLDKGTSEFTPGKVREFRHEIFGMPVRLHRVQIRDGAPLRGHRVGGYLIVLRDQEGRVVQYETSKESFLKNIAKLEELPLNANFDRECNRTFPTQPNQDNRPSWNL